MRALKKLCNYFFYCGIEKDEYNAVKKDAYVSNFVIWRILHFFMTAVFGVLFVVSLIYDLLSVNRLLYLAAFLYSAVALSFFFTLKKDSIWAQLLIYLSISLLFIFGCFLTSNNATAPATTFIALLLVTPMFMIDKPFWMAFELSAASALFLIWMYYIKPYEIWRIDVINVIIYTVVGIFLNVIANSVRIREFILTREIKIQKDTDDMTGLKNKGALTRAINKYLANPTTKKGIMFMIDIDRFKLINDTYGHDIGDSVISQLGIFLGKKFTKNEITGRFGGDEFIVFIKNTNDETEACRLADSVIK